jgi:hypothetical protein
LPRNIRRAERAAGTCRGMRAPVKNYIMRFSLKFSREAAARTARSQLASASLPGQMAALSFAPIPRLSWND